MKSCIYEGQVRHRRFAPREHCFDYRLYMMYLDLAELPNVFDRFWLWSARRRNIAWFDRSVHMGDADRPLESVVRDRIRSETGKDCKGPIRLLTHCRYFGFGFNPVSFYYCYNEDDTGLDYIVAEVNNTPWGDQHCYVLAESENQGFNSRHKKYSLHKDFHVSPFMPMDMDYDWRFAVPDERLTVHMQNFIKDEKLFDATLDLKRVPISSFNMARVLFRYPVVTAKVVAGIYYQALKLTLKRIPFFDHPEHQSIHIETKQS